MEAQDYLSVTTLEKDKADEEATYIDDIVQANTKVFTAVKLTEKFDEFIAADTASKTRYETLEKDLEQNHEQTTIATMSSDTATLATLAT